MKGFSKTQGEEIQRWAAAEPAIRRVWLYGSRADGTHRPDSDLDIAVEVEPVGDSEETLLIWLENKAAWSSQLQKILPEKVDLEWFDPDGGTQMVEAGLNRVKVLVYER